jgi:hypothetical protein
MAMFIVSGANISYQCQNDTIDTFSGTTLVARDGYIKPQILAVKVDTYYDLICEYGSWNCTIMYRIMECESKGNPDTINIKDKHRTCNGSYGLMQLSCEHLTDYDIWNSWNDPAENIRVAYDVWKRQGYNAWKRCYNSL